MSTPHHPEEIFTQVWLEHQLAIRQMCRRCMTSDADAEEAFSRASVRIYLKLKEQRDVENLRAWLLRLAFNVCMSLHRENRRRGEKSFEEIESDAGASPPSVALAFGGTPEGSFLTKELSDFLWRSIFGLPERLRETMLSHLALANYREVADRLSINETNVRKRMQEARAILSRQLAEYRAGEARRAPASARAKPRKAAGGHEETLSLRRRPATDPARRLAGLERYVERHPRGWKRRLDLAHALLAEGRPEEAVRHLEPVVDQQPRQVEAWLALISAYRFLGRPEAVASACERALAASNKEGAAALIEGLRRNVSHSHNTRIESVFRLTDTSEDPAGKRWS
jgi:RNA polymerase sigma-70 factor (ECF subfamily)